MQYKEIVKLEEGTKIGYALINIKRGTGLVTSDGALIIRNKVKDFGFKKGFIPYEVSFEQVANVMIEYEGLYAYDEKSLILFLDKLKEELPEIYYEAKFNEIEATKLKEQIIVLGIKINQQK